MNKLSLITGATSRIGKAAASELAKFSFDLILTHEMKSSDKAYYADKAKQLWGLSEKLCGIKWL